MTADAVDNSLIKAKAGNPDDESNIPFTSQELTRCRILNAIVSMVLDMIIVFFVTSFGKFQLESVRKDNFAHAIFARAAW